MKSAQMNKTEPCSTGFSVERAYVEGTMHLITDAANYMGGPVA